ncbi:hypothetical protein [Cellulomonas sp.]|uniref:hypothetical protein n=1 Tax=Cellulomonas sp. TaxID=40001 RepID=UPI003BA8BCEA
MPREIVVLSPTAPDARALVEAGASVDPELGLRTLHGGAVHQVVRADGGEGRAVLSIHQPLTVQNAAEIRRLLPSVRQLPTWATDGSPLWWVEALVPWNAADARTGLAVVQEMTARLGGLCVVQDGE